MHMFYLGLTRPRILNPDDYMTMQIKRSTRIRLKQRKKRKESYDRYFTRILDLYEASLRKIGLNT